MLRWILLFSLLMMQTACDSPANKDRPAEPLLNSTKQSKVKQTQFKEQTTVQGFEPLVETDLLNEPTPVYRFETTAEALSIWRRAPERPTLLLLSNNPHLTPVPEEFRQKTTILIGNANAKTLALATTDRNPAPLILPGMAVDAALRNGWFKELAWALPLRDPSLEVNLEKFTEQLSQTQLANDNEISSIAETDRTFHGTLRNTAFRAAALPLLQGLQQPVIVHIDLSYFQPLYKNEIATPLLDVVFNTLTTLKKMHLQTLAVTFSYGHLDSQISLDVRFLGDLVADLIEDPARLDQAIPSNWQRQRDALYLANFFQKDKIRELYEAQEKDAPEAAWVKFNLYRSAAEHKEGAKALEYLEQAVNLDSIYALEYSELSNLAYEKQRPDEALRMLGLAAEVFHEDPFLKLQMAQLANQLGEKEQALELLNKIRNLQWSDIYYPQIPQYLADFTASVQSGHNESEPHKDVKENSDFEKIAPDFDPAKQRIMHTR